MRLSKMNRIMDTVTEGNQGGGGTGSLLTASSGGGGSDPSKGNEGTAPGANANAASAGDKNPPASSTAGNTDWKSSLPKELQEEPSLKLIHDLPALAKSYINAQKLVGSDKIPVPSKHATEDDWKAVYQKLGLPQDVKEYQVKFKEGLTLEKDFVENFKQTAHKAGILPRQAQALADWFGEVNATAEEQIQKGYKQLQEQKIGELRGKWGAAFDKKVGEASRVIQEIGDPELLKFLDDTGLGNEPKLIEAFSTLYGKFLKEANDKGGANAMQPVMTPKEAQGEINKIMSQVGVHPYFVKDHPNHKAALEEMNSLFNLANPAKSPVDNRI